MVNIKVNGNDRQHVGETISYEDVLKLDGRDPKRVLSVTYQGQSNGDLQREGGMRPGCEPVRVEEGMRFAVADTSNA